MTFLHKENLPLMVARGKQQSALSIHKFGANPSIGATLTNGYETVWYAGGLYTWPEAANTVTIVSTSNDDLPASFGASEVVVEGLDANFDIVTETIALNGNTSVTTTNDFYRVNRVYASAMGTTASNATNPLGTNIGLITGNHNEDDTTVFEIAPYLGQTQLGFYSVPNGYTAYIYNWTVSSAKEVAGAGTNIEISAFLMHRLCGTPDLEPFRIADEVVCKDNKVDVTYDFPSRYPSRTDFEVRASVSSGSAPITTHFNVLLIEE